MNGATHQQHNMPNLDLDALAREVDELPTNPAVADRIVSKFTQNPSLVMADLETAMFRDPALTLKVLRLANSPPFGASGRISTMTHAMARFDIHIAKLVALSFNLKLAEPHNGFDYAGYWRQSQAMAVVAPQLARYFPEVNILEAQIAAVLSDIGRLMVAEFHPETYAEITRATAAEDRPIEALEQEQFGFEHAYIAARVMQHWSIPSGLTDAIQVHLHPSEIEAASPHSRELAKVVYLSACAVRVLLYGDNGRFEAMREWVERWIKLDVDGCSVLLGSLVDPIEHMDNEWAQGATDASRILAMARKLMVQESLATATSLLITARQAEETQAQIEKLQKHRERLEQQVTTDALTGIGNRKHFEDEIRKETKRCLRARQPLSLIMFDLDHFKRLNDTFGHPAGDEVLKATTRAIRECLRASDDLSRYGGEEFIVIVPETDSHGAEALADRMREKLERTRTTFKGHELGVTASFGVVTVTDLESAASPEQIVQTADNALYQAKRAGRNCVRVSTLHPPTEVRAGLHPL